MGYNVFEPYFKCILYSLPVEDAISSICELMTAIITVLCLLSRARHLFQFTKVLPIPQGSADSEHFSHSGSDTIHFQFSLYCAYFWFV